jgi:glyoxylase-like metal-dependent hydrolase (beta-lactamase superfamily II)
MKWVFRVVGIIGVFLIVVIGTFLIPAHMQIRDVAPVLPGQKKILSLRDIGGPVRVTYILTSSQMLERGEISHISIVVEWLNGRMLLIDTGMSAEKAESFSELLKLKDSLAGDVKIYGTVTELLGDSINNIMGVAFTHLHIDHTQGVQEFCDIRGQGAVLLQTYNQKELHNFNTNEGADLLASSCLKQLELSQGETENFYQSSLFPGVAAIDLGGHTPGSTLWAVALDNKILLFSGDISNVKNDIDQNIDKDMFYSYFIVPENTKRTSQLRQWLRTLDQSNNISVIVSHDLVNTQAYVDEYEVN